MSADVASVARETDMAARIVRNEVPELTAFGRETSALPPFQTAHLFAWPKTFGALFMWLHKKQAKINISLYEEAQRREATDRPPRWR